MPLNNGQLSFRKVKSTFVGSPIQDIKDASNTLYNRASNNDVAMNQMETFANSINVMDKDIENKNEAINTLTEKYTTIADNNSYAYAGKQVRQAAKDFNNNQALQYSIKQKADIDAVLIDAEKKDVSQNRINAWRKHWAASGERITIDPETGVVHGYMNVQNMVANPDINKQVLDILTKFKYNEGPLKDNNGNIYQVRQGEYFITGKEQSVSEDRIYSAAMQMVLNDPNNISYFNELKQLDDYSMNIINPETGKYVLDENNQPIKGTLNYDENGLITYEPINYMDKLNQIRISTDAVQEYIDNYNKDNGTNLTVNSEGVLKAMYDSNFIMKQADGYASMASTIGGYSRVTLDYKTMQEYMANVRYNYAVKLEGVKDYYRQLGEIRKTQETNKQAEIAKNKANKEQAEIAYIPSASGNTEGIGVNGETIMNQYRGMVNKINSGYDFYQEAINKQLEANEDLKEYTTNGKSIKWREQKIKYTDKNGNIKTSTVSGTLEPYVVGGNGIYEIPITQDEKESIIKNLDDATFRGYKKMVSAKNDLNKQGQQVIDKLSQKDLFKIMYDVVINKRSTGNITREDMKLVTGAGYNNIWGNPAITDDKIPSKKVMKNLIKKYDLTNILMDRMAIGNDQLEEQTLTYDLSDKALNIIPNYYKDAQTGFNRTDLKIWTPSTKENIKTLNTRAISEFISPTSKVYTEDGKDFRKLTAEELLTYFDIDASNSNYSKAKTYFYNNTGSSILKDIAVALKKNSNDTYLGFNVSGKIKGVIANKIISIPLKGEGNEDDSELKIAIPGLFYDMPPNFSYKIDNQVVAVTNQTILELAQSPSKINSINITQYPDLALTYTNNGIGKWSVYNADGTVLATDKPLTEIVAAGIKASITEADIRTAKVKTNN